MSSTAFHDVWGYRTPPAWAVRALEKGIIDAGRFEALLEVAAEEGDAARRRLARRTQTCSCRRRPRRACTAWRA
jgi:hypothetical protein